LKTFIGIDIGSLATKIVLLNEGKLLDHRTERSTYDFKKIGQNLFNDILNKHNLKRSDVFVMSTGYGRNTVDFADDRVTEITAHAKGVQYFFPDAHSVIDIGGQDSKAIVMSKKKETITEPIQKVTTLTSFLKKRFHKQLNRFLI